MHNVHVFAGENDQSPTLAQTEIIEGPGATASVTFTTPSEPGRYLFICDVHPTMRGYLVVRP